MTRPSKRPAYPSKEELIEAYHLSSIPKLAKHFGFGKHIILKLLKEYGIPRHPAGFRPPKLNDANLDDVRKRYRRGESQISIANHYGTTPTTVIKFMKKNGIATRSSGKCPKYEGEFAEIILDPKEVGHLYSSGITLKQISMLYGISYVDVYNFVRRHRIIVVSKPQNLLHLATPEIIKALYENGMMMKDIATKFNVSLLTLYKYRKQHNVLIDRGRKPIVATSKIIKVVEDLYYKGLSAIKISKKLRISYARILKIMKPLRVRSKHDRR